MGASLSELERRAVLALWTVPGLGPKCLEALRGLTGGPLGPLLTAPVSELAVALPPHVRVQLVDLQTVEPLAEVTFRRCQRAGLKIAWMGDPAYPPTLARCQDAPPLLFHLGEPGPPRRRLAMVGSRHPDAGFLIIARKFAQAVAEQGVVICSGAAEGVDRACHFGALDRKMETWAFVGSALDELDAAQAQLLPAVLKAGGAFYSELPPGIRASKASFPRRNRLISGSAHAVLVLRAGVKSGALYTASAALRQGRPVLAIPGELDNPAATGCNHLIRMDGAVLCVSPGQACEAAGVTAVRPEEGQRRPAADLRELSPAAMRAYTALVPGRPMGFDALLLVLGIPSGTLLGALCELELSGLLVQLPGKRYERVD